MNDQLVQSSSFGSMGTLSSLNDSYRQQLIDYCPEMKMMFPSLHNPSCFGAEPNALDCFKYLCEYGGLKCRNSQSINWISNKKKNHIKLEMTIT